MNPYITGAMIKRLRERQGLTQTELVDRLTVSDKAVSKWETGKGYPDITLIEPLAKALNISVIELFSGDAIVNQNRSFNILRCKLYVCPLCGNVIFGTGEAVVSCCGITLPAIEAEAPDAAHSMTVETVEDEYDITVNHAMTKEHYISFFAAVTYDGIRFIKQYPEGNAQIRLRKRNVRILYAYCNRHGLFMLKF